MREYLKTLVGLSLMAESLTKNKNMKEVVEKSPVLNPLNLVMSYRTITPPEWGKKGKAPFKVPVVDATLNGDNRILAGQIIKAANRHHNQSKYIR
jgi:hypothetical protein